MTLEGSHCVFIVLRYACQGGKFKHLGFSNPVILVVFGINLNRSFEGASFVMLAKTQGRGLYNAVHEIKQRLEKGKRIPRCQSF